MVCCDLFTGWARSTGSSVPARLPLLLPHGRPSLPFCAVGEVWLRRRTTPLFLGVVLSQCLPGARRIVMDRSAGANSNDLVISGGCESERYIVPGTHEDRRGYEKPLVHGWEACSELLASQCQRQGALKPSARPGSAMGVPRLGPRRPRLRRSGSAALLERVGLCAAQHHSPRRGKASPFGRS